MPAAEDEISIRPCGQAVKTAPSHGAIPGSIPGKVTIKKMSTHGCAHFFVYGGLAGQKRKGGGSCEAFPPKLNRGDPFRGVGGFPAQATWCACSFFYVWRLCRAEEKRRRFARGVSAEAQPRGPLQGCRLIPCTGCAVCLLIFCVWRPCRAEEKRRRGRAACS